MKNNISVKQVQELPLEKIKIHPLLEQFVKPKKKDHIEYTMNRLGQFTPLLGNLIGDTFYVTDGIVRLEVAKSLGLKTLQCLHINIPDEDAVKIRLTSNQRTNMSYSEMAHYGEHMLGLIGKSQGKKRDLMGFDFIDKDEHYGLVGKDRFEMVCHLLNLPIKASSLRKLMEVKWFEDENPGNKVGIMAGLENGLYKIDKAHQLLGEKAKKEAKIAERKRKDYEGKVNDISFHLFNTSSMDLSDIPDSSMRMFIQSPPYFQLREYRNQPDYFIHGQEETLKEYIENEVKFYRGAKRKLLSNGVVVIIIGETYRDGYQGVCTKLETALEKDGWYILDVNTFVKTNAKATPHVARFLNSKETIIVAGLKPANETLFNDVTRPSSIGEFKVIPGSSRTTGGKGYSMASPESSITNVFIESVFQKSEYSDVDDEFFHQAPTSVDIYEKFILGYSNPGENVGELFLGSGSGLESAILNGRHGYGWDVDHESIDFCNKRLKKRLEEREQTKIELSIAA
ncbi:DNA methyltransferase [Aquirufa sp. Wall-65K1]